jgi:hypothetical protein
MDDVLLYHLRYLNRADHFCKSCVRHIAASRSYNRRHDIQDILLCVRFVRIIVKLLQQRGLGDKNRFESFLCVKPSLIYLVCSASNLSVMTWVPVGRLFASAAGTKA